MWGCPHTPCTQKQALTLAVSGCFPAPPGHAQAPEDGDAAERRSEPRTALPVPGGDVQRSLRGSLLKEAKRVFLGINRLVTESINSYFLRAKRFGGPGCRESRDAGSQLWDPALGLGGDPALPILGGSVNLPFQIYAQFWAHASSWRWRDDLRSLLGKN